MASSSSSSRAAAGSFGEVTQEGVALTQRKFAEALHERRVQMEQLEKFKSDYAKLDDQLRTLPNSLSHQVMVPFGDGVGFMPGKIKNTNHIYVLLGDDNFALRTAPQARSILARRQEFLDDKIEDLKKEFDNLKAKLGFTAAEFSKDNRGGDEDDEDEYEDDGVADEEEDEDEEELFEIREEYFSDDENPDHKDVMGTVTPFKTKVAKSKVRVEKLLDEMERLEGKGKEVSSTVLSPADLTQMPQIKSSLKKPKDEKQKKQKQSGRRVSFAGEKEEETEFDQTYQQQPKLPKASVANQQSQQVSDSKSAFGGVIKEKPFDPMKAFSGVVKERDSNEDAVIPTIPSSSSKKTEKKVSLFKQAALHK